MRLSPKAKKNQQEDNAFYIHLGKKLRQARRTKVNEFTGKETIVPQTKVANALKTTFQQIGKYEKGTNGLSAIRLMQMSEHLKVPYTNLLPELPSQVEPLSNNSDVILAPSNLTELN